MIQKDVKFIGTIFLPGVSGRDIKLFDLEGKKIVLIYTNNQKYEDKIYNYNYFNEYYPMPLILYQDQDKSLIMEEFIDFKSNDDWDKNDYLYVMEDILNRTIKYFNTISKEGNYILKTPIQILEELPKEDKTIQYIEANISEELKSLEFPFIKLHGDMWTPNILIDKRDNKINYIDFELSNKLILFYDIFTMIWNELFNYNRDIYLRQFLKGEYDIYFSNMFSFFDLEYKCEYKLDYLHIFFLVLFRERWSNPKKGNKTTIFNQHERFNLYKSFFNKVDEIKKKT